jgi:hypothetical protein
LLNAAASLAQTEMTPLPPAPPRPPIGQVQFGNVTVTPFVTLAHIGIDNNVMNTSGEPRSDFTATVSPQIKSLYTNGRFDLEATAASDYVFYKTFRDQAGLAPRVSVRAEYRFSPRMAVFSNDELASFKDRPTVEIDTRSRRTVASASAGVRLGLSRRADLELTARRRATLYASGVFFRGIHLRDTLNEQRTEGAAVMVYKATPYTTIRTIASIENLRFPLSRERDGLSREIAVGFKFSPRALIAGDAQIGYRMFRSSSALQPDFDGPVVDGRVTYALTETTGLRVGGHRDLVSSFDPVHPYLLETRYEGAVQQRLGRQFDIGVDYTAVDMRYRTLLTLATLAGDRDAPLHDAVTTYGLSVGLLTRHWGRYAVYVSRWDRTSDFDASRNYRNTRVGLMIGSTRWLTGQSTHGFFVDTPGL